MMTAVRPGKGSHRQPGVAQQFVWPKDQNERKNNKATAQANRPAGKGGTVGF
jgi:hypothetical protein